MIKSWVWKEERRTRTVEGAGEEHQQVKCRKKKNHRVVVRALHGFLEGRVPHRVFFTPLALIDQDQNKKGPLKLRLFPMNQKVRLITEDG